MKPNTTVLAAALVLACGMSHAVTLRIAMATSGVGMYSPVPMYMVRSA